MRARSVSYPLLLLLFLCSTLQAAGNVEVTWQDPDSYRDIRPADEAPRRFRARLFRELERHLEQLANGLPKGYELAITFTNVQLAGRVETGPRGSARIIRDSDPARLEFSYRLADSRGKKLREGRERLWGTTTSVPSLGTRRGEAFAVEKALLSQWFKRTISILARDRSLPKTRLKP